MPSTLEEERTFIHNFYNNFYSQFFYNHKIWIPIDSIPNCFQLIRKLPGNSWNVTKSKERKFESLHTSKLWSIQIHTQNLKNKSFEYSDRHQKWYAGAGPS